MVLSLVALCLEVMPKSSWLYGSLLLWSTCLGCSGWFAGFVCGTCPSLCGCSARTVEVCSPPSCGEVMDLCGVVLVLFCSLVWWLALSLVDRFKGVFGLWDAFGMALHPLLVRSRNGVQSTVVGPFAVGYWLLCLDSAVRGLRCVCSLGWQALRGVWVLQCCLSK